MGFEYLWILLLVSALISAIGFYKYVYFLSIGYGFSIAGIGITLAIMSIAGVFKAEIQDFILFVILAVYGLRLSIFLILREVKNGAYRKKLQEVSGDDSKVPLFVKIAIWITVSILYVAQTSPAFYILYNGTQSSTIIWIAIGISTFALILESIADYQKTKQKRIHPDMVATRGLYKIVRCPNYLGEILFWTGIYISGFNSLNGWGQWFMASISYVCIVYIMFDGAKRLEKRQMKSYGNNPEYIKYSDSTPIIIPLLPIYHLNKKVKD